MAMIAIDRRGPKEKGQEDLPPQLQGPHAHTGSIIAISAIEAYYTGVYHFYQASNSVWLSDYIHPNFIELLK